MRSGPFSEVETPPNRLRWDPLPMPAQNCDFVEGLTTIAGCGDPASQIGLAVHVYRANRSMVERCLWNADGEMMFVPQQGGSSLWDGARKAGVAPGEIAVVPRGMKFRGRACRRTRRAATCAKTTARRSGFRSLDHRLARASPSSATSRCRSPRSRSRQLRGGGQVHGRAVASELGALAARRGRVARHYVPYKYDLARFMVIKRVSFDHPDPSIFRC